MKKKLKTNIEENELLKDSKKELESKIEEKLKELNENLKNKIDQINKLSEPGEYTRKLDRYLDNYQEGGNIFLYFLNDVRNKLEKKNKKKNKKLILDYLKKNNIKIEDINSEIDLLFNNFYQIGGVNIDDYIKNIDESLDNLIKLYKRIMIKKMKKYLK